MIGKLIAFAPTRKEAIAKMKWALAEFLVDGVDTNIEFQLQLIGTPEFQSGEYDNGYLMERPVPIPAVTGRRDPRCCKICSAR